MNKKIYLWLATGLGVGYLPKMPGTFGSLWGLVLIYLFQFIVPPHLMPVLIILIMLFAVHVSTEAEKIMNTKDFQGIVIDEIVGQMIVFCFVPMTLRSMIVGFLLFRLFDVIKLPPANWAQNKLKNGWGVVMDDVVAGLQAGLVCLVLHGYLSVTDPDAIYPLKSILLKADTYF